MKEITIALHARAKEKRLKANQSFFLVVVVPRHRGRRLASWDIEQRNETSRHPSYPVLLISQQAFVFQNNLKMGKEKIHISLVVIGHVDAGEY